MPESSLGTAGLPPSALKAVLETGIGNLVSSVWKPHSHHHLRLVSLRRSLARFCIA